eukprot:scaffold65349_cov35-Tisochrysis_lutea.AAC.4
MKIIYLNIAGKCVTKKGNLGLHLLAISFGAQSAKQIARRVAQLIGMCGGLPPPPSTVDPPYKYKGLRRLAGNDY